MKSREKALKWYNQNKINVNAKRKATSEKEKADVDPKKPKRDRSEYMRSYRQNLKEKKRKNAEKVSKWRQKQKQEANVEVDVPSESETTGTSFKNRMAKSRAVKQVKECISILNANQRSEVMVSVINSLSPVATKTRKIMERQNTITSARNKTDLKAAKALINDISEGFQQTGKRKGSIEAHKRTTVAATSALCFGSNVKKQRLQKNIAEQIGVNRKVISSGIKQHEKILKGGTNAWNFTKRKTRKDQLDECSKKKIYKFWEQNSQPVNDARRKIRERVGPKQYIEHSKYILTKSQTEIYLDFVKKYPEIKVKQRTFEKLRPFYIKPARKRDRLTCLCRAHVETQILFRNAKAYRESLKSEDKPVWGKLQDLVEETLCPANSEGNYKQECLERKCTECGVSQIKLYERELNTETETVDFITWQKYKYVNTGKKNKAGQEIKKLELVNVSSPPGEMWAYFKEKLEVYPLHQFQARWQRDQLDNILGNLRNGHVLMIHDFSGDFKIEAQDETQSEFFSKTEISIHVSVLYRHAVLEYDGRDSSENNPEIIKEYIFGICEDSSHDYNIVHHIRNLIIQKHLRETVNYPLQFIHEFTDGCSQQYKSRHCMGDVSMSNVDFQVPTQRNYFETAHGKGEQDAAGSHIKNKAAMAIVRREVQIRSASDFYQFLNTSFKTPAVSTFKSRVENVQLNQRVFFFIPSSDIQKQREGRSFKPIKNNRCIHSIRSSSESGQLLSRKRTCYCIMCIDEDYEQCLNKHIVDSWKTETLITESNTQTDKHKPTKQEQRDSFVLNSESLLTSESIVAVPNNTDSNEDFFLLKVISHEPYIAKSSECNALGQSFDVGEEVVDCVRYNCKNVHDLSYQLDPKKKILTLKTENIIYICPDLQGKKTLRLPLHVYDEIVDSSY